MIVVTGATGNVGRPLTQVLAEAGEQVMAVSRHAAAVPDGVRHVAADLAELTSLTPALDGAKALFLLLSGDLHAPGARPTDIIDLAAASGVRRVVLLSSQGVATRPLGPSRIALRAVEDALRESGLDWAVLRPGGFASNALAWADSVRTQGTVAAPFGDIGVPVVDPVDIAEVAAACLLDDRHAAWSLRADRARGDHATSAGGGHRHRARLAGAIPRTDPRGGQGRDDPVRAAGARRRHPGHHRRPEPGRTTDQLGRGTSPRPRPEPLRRLGRPEHRRFSLRPISAEAPGPPRATTAARGGPVAHLPPPARTQEPQRPDGVLPASRPPSAPASGCPTRCRLADCAPGSGPGERRPVGQFEARAASAQPP